MDKKYTSVTAYRSPRARSPRLRAQGGSPNRTATVYIGDSTATDYLKAELSKKVDIKWFLKLFHPLSAEGLTVEPNDYDTEIDNIRAMFGFWSEKWISALGKSDKVSYNDAYLTDSLGNYITDSDGNYITVTKLLAGGASLDEEALWALLEKDGASEMYADAQIGSEHLTEAFDELKGNLSLDDYAKKSDVETTDNALSARITANGNAITALQASLKKKVDVDWFKKVFAVHDAEGNEIEPNDTDSTIADIQAQVGLWTEHYLSALGKNGTAASASGLDEAAMWEALAESDDSKQIDVSHLTDALAEYSKTGDLSKYALASDLTAEVSRAQAAETANTNAITAASTSIKTLQGYFTDGVAKKAARLSNTAAIGSATQPVYFSADGVPVAATSYDKLFTAFAYADATRVLTATIGGTTKTVTLPLATVSVAGLVSTEAQSFAGVKTFTAGKIVLSSGTNTVTLEVDESGDLHVDKGLYSDSFVSALGKNSASPSVGGLDEAAMWEALAATSGTYATSDYQINAVHLTEALADYAKTADLHTHTNKDVLDGITSTLVSNWSTAYSRSHTHTNKTVLDGITAALISNWNSAYTWVTNVTATDTDDVINKWQEIIAFLDGISSSTDLNGIIEGISSQIASNATAISDETARAKSAESTLTTNLDSEISRAKEAEQTLTSNLDAETERAKAAEAEKVDIKWFLKLFHALDVSGNTVTPNDYSTAIDNIEAMLGFWSKQYISALGRNDKISYTEIYLTDSAGNYILDEDGNYLTVTKLISEGGGSMNEQSIWELLAKGGASSEYENAQIGAEHLTDAFDELASGLSLSKYALASDLTSEVSRAQAAETANTNAITSLSSTLTSHTGDTSNPHKVTKAQVELGNVENTALSTWAGTSNITTLGTIATGTWHGSKIANDYLANSSITIAGTAVALGGSITAATIASKLYWANVKVSDTSSTSTTPTFGSIKIGTVTLTDDNGTLHIDKGLYSDSFVSALGKNASSASTGMSESDMWEALGTDSDTKVIPSAYLDLSGVSGTVDLTGYATQTWVTEQGYLTASAAANLLTGYVPTSRTVNGNALSADISLTASDVGASATSHTHSVKINGSTYTIAASGGTAVNLGTYLTSHQSLAHTHSLTIGNSNKSVSLNGSQSWTLSEIGAAEASHNHTITSLTNAYHYIDDTTNSWDSLGGRSGTMLTAVRNSEKTPAYLAAAYCAGIAFGGADTKGVISLAYGSPLVKFAGGAGTLWDMAISGTSGATYNLANFITASANVASATKATQDGDGNTISSTYLKLTGGTVTGGLTAESGISLGTSSGSSTAINIYANGRNWQISHRGTISGATNQLHLYKRDGSGTWYNVLVFSDYSADTSKTDLSVSNDIKAGSWCYASEFVASSDMRRKNVIANVGMSIDEIARSPLFRFTWKDKEQDGDMHIGTSAQYWQDICPELVHADKEGFLSLNYAGLATMMGIMLARGLRKTDSKVRKLERKVRMLEQRVAELEENYGHDGH